LQRNRRHAASALPRKSPCARNASTAYCEQEGWYLQVVGKRAPKGDAIEPDDDDAEAVHQCPSR